MSRLIDDKIIEIEKFFKSSENNLLNGILSHLLNNTDEVSIITSSKSI